MKKIIYIAAALALVLNTGCMNMFEILPREIMGLEQPTQPAPYVPMNEPSSDTAVTDAAEAAAPSASEYTAPANNFSATIEINDTDEFLMCLTEARDFLVPEVKFKLNDYTDEKYDINLMPKGKYSLASQGKQWGSTAYMTYNFDYSTSFKVSTAIERPYAMQFLSDAELATVDRLKDIKNSIVSDDMSPYEKELAIHDYLVKNFKYDTAAVSEGEIADSATDISVFLNTGSGVCEAYSYTFKALCDLSGIEAHVVTGKLGNVGHAWNLVKLDGEYYHVDVTSDDPIPDEPQHVYYTYFNVPDSYIENTHTPENKWYECSSDRYSYFVYNSLVVSNGSELKTLIENKISQGNTTVLFKADDYSVTEDDLMNALRNKGFTSYTLIGDPDNRYGDFELRLQ